MWYALSKRLLIELAWWLERFSATLSPQVHQRVEQFAVQVHDRFTARGSFRDEARKVVDPLGRCRAPVLSFAHLHTRLSRDSMLIGFTVVILLICSVLRQDEDAESIVAVKVN